MWVCGIIQLWENMVRSTPENIAVLGSTAHGA